VRIQLARTRAGLADATALRPDVDALRRVLDAPAALPVPRPLEAV
jgi:hypothetical protein